VSVVVDAMLLWALNMWPGWEMVPFVTGDLAAVVPLLNACLVAGIVTNTLWLVADPPWWRALGDLVVTSIGLAALLSLWREFPFAFGEGAFDWQDLARVVLAVAIAGSAIGIVVDLVRLVRAVPGHAVPSGLDR
jgi:hypothetical protein